MLPQAPKSLISGNTSDRMKLRSGSTLRISFGLALVAFFLYLAFKDVHFDELWKSLISIRYEWVILFIIVAIISHIVRAVRWKYLLAPIKSNVSVHKLFSAIMIGYLVNNAIPRAGEIARAHAVGKFEEIPKSAAFGTVIVERILDIVTFFFILCAVLFLYPNSLTAVTDNIEEYRMFFLAGSILSLLLFVWLFLRSEWLFGHLKKITLFLPDKYSRRVEGVLETFLSGFKIASDRKHFLPIVLTSVLMWLCYVLTLYFAFFAFDPLRELNLGMAEAVVLMTFSTIAFILPVPGAFGTYHSFMTLALVKLYNVDQATALSYSVLTHEVGFIVIVVVGVFYFLKDHLTISEIRQ